jgi:hypothetical protein
MVSNETLTRLINIRLTKLLRFAEAAIPEGQYKAFRSLVLDEFGNSGLLRDLETLSKQDVVERQGTGRRT